MLPGVVNAQLSYADNGDGTATITSCDPNYDGVVTIPSSTNGLTVISIGDSAFLGCGLTGVMIPDSVTSIWANAFCDCTSLTNVMIGNHVTSIGYFAFACCWNLTDVYFQGNAPSADSTVFFCDNNATVYYLPGTTGWSSTFDGLPTVMLVQTQLQLSYADNGDGTATITWCNPNYEGAVTIPSSTNGLTVTSIGDCAFFGCCLAGVMIPDSVTSIGFRAFFNDSGLTSVAIPQSVTSIGDAAFYGCAGLSAITVDTNNPSYSSVDGVLFNKSQTTLIQYPARKADGSCTIPDNVTSIGGGAFAFTSLTNVTIPDSVTSIGDSAFDYCYSLASITIPDSVTSIGGGTFYDCTSLTGVMIGNSVTNIGDWAFAYCYNLTSVYFQGNAPSVGSWVFTCDNNATVYYLPGTTVWSSTFGGLPTALWYLPNPLILNFEPTFGVQTNCFGFTISWATNISVVVEACTDLANPGWSPVETNTLAAGSCYFSDPAWTNYPNRFYRLRSP